MEQLQSTKRPTAITVICLIGWVGVLISIGLMLFNLNVFSHAIQLIGRWYLPYLIFSFIIGFTCFIGLWYMKKWAAYTYIAFFPINQIVLITTHKWNVLAILLPGILIAIIVDNIKKMD